MKAGTIKTIRQLCKQSPGAEVLYLVQMPDGTEKEIKGDSAFLKMYEEKTGATLKNVIIRIHSGEDNMPFFPVIR